MVIEIRLNFIYNTDSNKCISRSTDLYTYKVTEALRWLIIVAQHSVPNKFKVDYMLCSSARILGHCTRALCVNFM